MNEFDDRPALLVVLGAGASYDCVPFLKERSSQKVGHLGRGVEAIADIRPPLTGDLVRSDPVRNHIMAIHKPATIVIDEIRRRIAFEGDKAGGLEAMLREYQDRGRDGQNKYIDMHMNAFRMFLRDQLWTSTDYMLGDFTGGLTNYVTAVRILNEWAIRRNVRLVFASFNYDLLLEDAIRRYRPEFDYCNIGAYTTASDGLLVVKPHGSVHWAWPNRAQQTTSSAVSADELAISSPQDAFNMTSFKSVNRQSQHIEVRKPLEVQLSFEPALPALALPVAGKSFAWPQEQDDAFARLHGAVCGMLTIGWRAAEPHFLDLLPAKVRQGAPLLAVVDPDGTDFQHVQSQLISAIPHAGVPDKAMGFTNLLAGNALPEFLKRIDTR